MRMMSSTPSGWHSLDTVCGLESFGSQKNGHRQEMFQLKSFFFKPQKSVWEWTEHFDNYDN